MLRVVTYFGFPEIRPRENQTITQKVSQHGPICKATRFFFSQTIFIKNSCSRCSVTNLGVYALSYVREEISDNCMVKTASHVGRRRIAPAKYSETGKHSRLIAYGVSLRKLSSILTTSYFTKVIHSACLRSSSSLPMK